jgi:death on curing protein
VENEGSLVYEHALTLGELLAIHELLILRFGGMRGVTEQGFGKLEAALAAPYLSMFGQELYPELADKAATLFYGLARSHGFTDGNKRVALVALLVLLKRSGCTLAASEGELYDFVITTADAATMDEVRRWVGARMVPLTAA